jgi:transcriptional regulator with XRE-family HTH domain
METSYDLGRRIRQARNNLGLSQRELAQRSEISVNTISLLERGQTSPTIATLQKLADSLSVEISYFFDIGKSENEVVFSKSNRRNHIQISEGFLSDLSPSFITSIIRPLELQIYPRSRTKKDISHSGFEFLYCLENELLYTISGKVYLLEKGDSLLFNANLPHHWQNSTDNMTRIIMIQIKTDEENEPCDLVKQTNS